MKYAYRGQLVVDLVLRDTAFTALKPGDTIDSPQAVNNILFEPLDAEAKTAYALFCKDWSMENPYAKLTPVAAAPAPTTSGGDLA